MEVIMETKVSMSPELAFGVILKYERGKLSYGNKKQ